jgi:hypothetical protein
VKPLCEEIVFSRRHWFAGTADVFGRWHGVGAILDYKTGRPDDVAADLQLAAYYGGAVEMRANGDTSDMIHFEPLTHTYTLDGVRLPSVTQVLQRAGLIDFSRIPAPILLSARDRGAAVHRALHYYNEGDLDAAFQYEFPEYWPYLEAWIKFLDESGFELATADDVVDLTHMKRYAVQLKKTGRYVVEPYTNPRDYADFLALRHAQAVVDARKPTAWKEFQESAA